jgi:Dynamin family
MRLSPLMASTDEVHECGGQVEPAVLGGAGGMSPSPGGNGADLDEREVWLGVLDELPTGVVPLTSIVTTIARGDADRLRVYFADGREEERPLDELAEYVTEARNPTNRLGVELARVELGHDLLRAGVELVDTPGIGSIHSHNTEVARAFLPRVDAALCVPRLRHPGTRPCGRRAAHPAPASVSGRAGTSCTW